MDPSSLLELHPERSLLLLSTRTSILTTRSTLVRRLEVIPKVDSPNLQNHFDRRCNVERNLASTEEEKECRTHRQLSPFLHRFGGLRTSQAPSLKSYGPRSINRLELRTSSSTLRYLLSLMVTSTSSELPNLQIENTSTRINTPSDLSLPETVTLLLLPRYRSTAQYRPKTYTEAHSITQVPTSPTVLALKAPCRTSFARSPVSVSESLNYHLVVR